MHAAVLPPNNEKLFAIAESQDGYFTKAQALDAGFDRSTHSCHVKAGNWIREPGWPYGSTAFMASPIAGFV